MRSHLMLVNPHNPDQEHRWFKSWRKPIGKKKEWVGGDGQFSGHLWRARTAVRWPGIEGNLPRCNKTVFRYAVRWDKSETPPFCSSTGPSFLEFQDCHLQQWWPEAKTRWEEKNKTRPWMLGTNECFHVPDLMSCPLKWPRVDWQWIKK